MMGFSDRSGPRRRLTRGAAVSALCAAALTLSLSSARAQNAEAPGDQAEWRQGYEQSGRLGVGRETTPILSAATIGATEAAIQQYQEIVARGGWGAVPGGVELKIGAKSKAVQALRQRLVASGDMETVAGGSSTYFPLHW